MLCFTMSFFSIHSCICFFLQWEKKVCGDEKMSGGGGVLSMTYYIFVLQRDQHTQFNNKIQRSVSNVRIQMHDLHG